MYCLPLFTCSSTLACKSSVIYCANPLSLLNISASTEGNNFLNGGIEGPQDQQHMDSHADFKKIMFYGHEPPSSLLQLILSLPCTTIICYTNRLKERLLK